MFWKRRPPPSAKRGHLPRQDGGGGLVDVDFWGLLDLGGVFELEEGGVFGVAEDWGDDDSGEGLAGGVVVGDRVVVGLAGEGDLVFG